MGLTMGHRSSFAAEPTVSRVTPRAAVLGAVTRVRFEGKHLDGVSALDGTLPFSARRVESETTSEQVVFDVEVAADATPGIGALRLAGSDGVSSWVLFLLDDLPVTPALRVGGAVTGTVGERAVERFALDAEAGERLTFDVVAERLGSRLDPALRLRDGEGRELLRWDDTPGLRRDVRASWTAPRTERYTLELFDAEYRGGEGFHYRLRLGVFPAVVCTSPLTLPKTEVSHVVALGEGLRAPLPAVPAEVAAGDVSVRLAATDEPGVGSAFLSARRTDGPLLSESEPNATAALANPCTLPVTLNGVLSEEADRDAFRFPVKAGERVRLRAEARSRGSAADLLLELHGPTGSRVALDDVAKKAEKKDRKRIAAIDFDVEFKATEAGEHVLTVEDLNQRGGAAFVYRLRLDRVVAPVDLSVAVDHVNVARGDEIRLEVSCHRRGFAGPIELEVVGLGEVAYQSRTIEKAASKGNLRFTLPVPSAESRPPAQAEAREFRVVGRARVGEAEEVVPVRTLPALLKLFSSMGYPPIELDGVIGLGLR